MADSMDTVPTAAMEHGVGGLPRVVLTHPAGGRVEAYLQGAHVTSWTGPGGDERLFVSRESRYEPGAAIRGGVPVIFPQFAGQGPLPKHGFARTAAWEVAALDAGQGAARAVFRLADSRATRDVWPHPFRAELTVELDQALTIHLSVENTGEREIDFTCALHTYFRVADVRRASVVGLAGVPYHDKTTGADLVEEADALEIGGETDRVYRETPGVLRIRDGAGGRSLVLEKERFADAVVWNPWTDGARALPDLGDDEYLHMLCVEAANAAAPVRLPAGQTWTGTQRISVG